MTGELRRRMLLEACATDDACKNSSTGVAKAPPQGPPSLPWRHGFRFRYDGVAVENPSACIEVKTRYDLLSAETSSAVPLEQRRALI